MSTSKKNAKPSAAKGSVPSTKPASGAKAGTPPGAKHAPSGTNPPKSAAPKSPVGKTGTGKPGASGTSTSSGSTSAHVGSSSASHSGKGQGNGKATPPAKAKGAGSPAPSAGGKSDAKATTPASKAASQASKAAAKAARPDSATRKKAAAQARAEVAWDKATAKAAEVDGGRRKLPKGGPSKADLRRYRDLLLAKRRALLSSSRELAAEALQAGGGEFSVDHMADHGSDNYEQDFNLKLLEGESEQLVEVRDALLKIDGKADMPFGLCEACSDDDQKLCESCPWIEPSRLDALPWTRLCVQTKAREEERSR